MKHEGYKEMLELAALDALGGEDLRVLREHLATCDECRAELAELRDAEAMLSLYAEPVVPSAELTARILNTPRMAPRAERAPGLTVAEDGDQGSSDEGEKPSAHSVIMPPRQPWLRRWGGASMAAALAAALIIVVLVIALVVLWNLDRARQAEVTRLSSRNDELQAELSRLPNRSNQRGGTGEPPEPGTPAVTPGAPPTVTGSDSRVVELTATGVAARARARLSYNRRTGVIELVVPDMPSPPAGKTYQLWLLVGSRPVSGGTFNTGPGGAPCCAGRLTPTRLRLRPSPSRLSRRAAPPIPRDPNTCSARPCNASSG